MYLPSDIPHPPLRTDVQQSITFDTHHIHFEWIFWPGLYNFRHSQFRRDVQHVITFVSHQCTGLDTWTKTIWTDQYASTPRLRVDLELITVRKTLFPFFIREQSANTKCGKRLGCWKGVSSKRRVGVYYQLCLYNHKRLLVFGHFRLLLLFLLSWFLEEVWWQHSL